MKSSIFLPIIIFFSLISCQETRPIPSQDYNDTIEEAIPVSDIGGAPWRIYGH
jgi:hypothetical protein